MEANKQPNMAKIHSTQDLINLLTKFSRATLKEDPVLQMLPYEKDQLRNLIEDDKHHAVTAMNILMYFQRRSLLDIDNENFGGQRIKWNDQNIQRFFVEALPQVYIALD